MFIRKTYTMISKYVVSGLLFLTFIPCRPALGQFDRSPAGSAVPQDRYPGVHITNMPGEVPQQQGVRPDFPTQGDLREQTSPLQIPEIQHFPPEPDLEFQDFVMSSLGYRLDIFGENLFQDVPSTFAPLDRLPLTPDYLIGPGDELLIRAWGQVDINYRAVVDRTGAIYLPKVGTISVAGVRYDHLNEHLKSEIGRVFKGFELDVSLGRLRAIQVFVVGQVRRPGSYTISSLSTVVNALFASGGPSKRGSMRNIVLKREGKEITRFDLYDLIVFGNKSGDAHLLPGDVIFVPPVGQLVALAGSVNLPSIYELKEHDTLNDVIRYAGGLTTTAAGQQAFVDRIDDHLLRRTTAFELSTAGLNTELRDGDIVRFLHISPRFDNALTLRGNVAVPGRYPWREGMRIKDLIPSRDFLITQDYWKRQNRLAIDFDNLTFKSRSDIQTPPTAGYPIVPPGTQPASPQPNPPSPAAPAVVTPQVPQQEQRNLGPDEELLARVGRTEAQRMKEEELKNDVKRSGTEINWEYAVILRTNPSDLTTQLLPFNLGKAINGVEDQNLVLQPGDVITIFSQKEMQVPAAQQTKFVRLEGEFYSAGVYQAEPGETLRHFITRIGGLTPQAYLYGAEFTRESAREDQQRRLEEYTNELEKSIERNSISQRSLSGDEAVTERQALESERRLLDKLRQLKATGRIILELKPNANSIDALPDLVLEDGDRLFVPLRPATVNVIGSVYNSNSFIFKPTKTVGDYMRLSGGATRDADKSRSFVIRADGTTVSSQHHSGLFTSSFSQARLMPGDTIIVPERLNKGATLRGIKDWTQIIGQFVLGAAAVKVLLQ